MKLESKNIKRIPRLNKLELLKWMPSLYFNTLPTVVKFLNKYGDILDLSWSKNSQMLLVNHPDYVQQILKTNQDNYSRKKILGNLGDLLGEGLFASEGKLWEQQHQLIKPALHDKLVNTYFDIINQETQLLVKDWEDKSIKKTAVDIEYDINVLMLKILIKTQLCPTFNEDFEDIIKSLRVFLRYTNPKNFFLNKIKNQIRAYFSLPPLKNKKAIEALKTIDQIIVKLRAKAAENPENKGLILNILENAKAEGLISEQQVLDEIKNFFFAGFDTTASALTWSLYCAAKYTDANEKLLAEINQVLGKRIPEFKDIGEMTYTKMFLQESMRLFPPVYSLLRVSLEDDHINEYFVPRKSWVAINIYALHRHPKYWEKPDEFIPERFNPSTFKGKAFVYIPFGQGKRSCIGKPLAMAELQIVLPIILQNFKLQLIDKKEPIITPDIIIKAKTPLLMKLEKC